jgi:hypothetical protein
VRYIFTNAAGGLAAFWLARRRAAWLEPAPRRALVLAGAWGAGWLALQVAGALLTRPWFPQSQYYGHLARALGAEIPLRGGVAYAEVAGIVIGDDMMPDSVGTYGRFAHLPLPVRVDVVPLGVPLGLAPIVRIVDSRQRELLLLAQFGDQLVVGVRTPASAARLRPTRYLLAAALPAAHELSASARDTLRIETIIDEDAITMRTRWRGRVAERVVRRSPSWTWSSIMPFQMHVGSTPSRVMTALWLAALLAPVGFWLGRWSRASRRGAASPFALLLLVALGLVAVPLAFGLSVSPVSEWIGAAGGAAVAWLAGRGGDARRVRGSILQRDVEQARSA